MPEGFQYSRASMTNLHLWIRRHTTGCRCVVDMGAGQFDKLNCVWPQAKKIGIEIFPAYLATAPVDVKAVLGDLRHWERYLTNGEADCAMLIDSLEHIPKQDGLDLLRSMQKRFNRIIVFTPLGFHPQEMDPINSENEYNAHECGWSEAELQDEGFETDVNPDFHGPKGGAIFAVWNRSEP